MPKQNSNSGQEKARETESNKKQEWVSEFSLQSTD